MDAANHQRAAGARARNNPGQIARLGYGTESGSGRRERPGCSDLQPHASLCRCDCDRWNGSKPFRLAVDRTGQSGHASGGADLAQSGLHWNPMMSEAFQVTLEAARLYERIAARYVLGPWAPSLVDAASVKQGDRVLDLARGTGVVARIAAQRTGVGGCVIGLDLNPGMIAVARLLPAEGAQVDWIEGSALDIPVPAASVDVVLCQQGLQFFPDKALALRE